MSSFADKFVQTAQRFLPSPFSIAILLTFFTALLALLLTQDTLSTESPKIVQIIGFWEKGFWELLQFAMQMMLILVLGHVLALSTPINKMINKLLFLCTNTAKAAFFVTFFTMLIALFNWGLGLVFGAIFARKVGEYAQQKKLKLNYPLIGAAGYSGLMVWHGGLSGSAPVIIAGEGHFLADKIGVLPLSDTVFSAMNIVASIAILILVPSLMYWLGKRTKSTTFVLSAPTLMTERQGGPRTISGAEKIDHSVVLASIFGGLIIGWSVYKAFIANGLSFLTLNYINFLLFGLGIILHGNIHNFTQAVSKAIQGSSGIMIQFPLYAGIMGIMKYSGLITVFSDFFVSIATDVTFPIFTFISAGIVNVFVPSGGGQWAVQGPIIVEAAQQLQVPMSKCVMALAYGDQLTNMMQPFWALPLLGITGLKAKEILPYTLCLMGLGIVIFSITLLLF